MLILKLIGIWFVVSLTLCLVLGRFFFWVAKGESEVNGDPERDAGIDPDVCMVCMDCHKHMYGPSMDEAKLLSHGLCADCAQVRRAAIFDNLHAENPKL